MKNYFNASEFSCKCGCGSHDIEPALVGKLNRARALAGIPFVINSGLRCVPHNEFIRGSQTSSHLTGLAVDIRVADSRQRFTIVKALMEVGFVRIGIAKSFIHADIDAKKPAAVWTY